MAWLLLRAVQREGRTDLSGWGHMRIGPSLILASRQTLAMTPQLQQAIKLLQFSHLELAAFIEQELEKNPLLQETHDDGPVVEADAGPLDSPADTAEALAAAAPAL